MLHKRTAQRTDKAAISNAPATLSVRGLPPVATKQCVYCSSSPPDARLSCGDSMPSTNVDCAVNSPLHSKLSEYSDAHAQLASSFDGHDLQSCGSQRISWVLIIRQQLAKKNRTIHY